MVRRKKSDAMPKAERTVDYRYPDEKRTNIPPGRIAGEGVIPKVPRARYSYSPHLPPTLRFDQTGKPDRVKELVEKAQRTPLSAAEATQLNDALKQSEPWLEWTSKRDLPSFAVDPVALHIHERVSAKAIVRVAARGDVQRELFADPQQQYHEAVQFYQHDIDWANRLILGDSLQVMASLAKREDLAGKVQMIYIDPPYGIKFKSNFQSEVGRQDVSEREKDLTREPEMIRAYRDTWNLGTHSYLSYLRDRLTVAHDLLSDSGSIFVQISDENLHRVRNLMDEVFGPDNACQVIPFRKKLMPLGATLLESMCDYLLWYAKNKPQVKFHHLYKRSVPKLSARWTGLQLNDGSKVKLRRGDSSEQGVVTGDGEVYRLVSQRAPSFSEAGVYEFLFNGKWLAPAKGGCWVTTEDKMTRLGKAERLELEGENLSYMMFHNDFPYSKITNFWDDTSPVQGKEYVVQTSSGVIRRCILMTTDPGDLVVDPTCGSGTTAHVAEQWGRRWVTIDTSRVAIAIARQRLLTSKFDYYAFKDDGRKVEGGFSYETAPHVTLKSIAQNTNLDPIFAKHGEILDGKLAACNSALEKSTDDLRRKLLAKLGAKQKSEGKKSITDADRRRWELPKKWEHSQVPFDTDEAWPHELQDAVADYRVAWRTKMDEVNACIEANAQQEELVDQPIKRPGILRVSGPFTVEGVRPEALNLDDDRLSDGSPNENDVDVSSNLPPINQQNLQAYLNQMVQLIRKDGLTFINNKRRTFTQVDSLFDVGTGAVLHAEGSWKDSASPDVLDVAIGFGPQYGPVTALQVEALIHASKRHNELVVAGFSFDADATALIQEQSHPKLRIHQAYIRPDVNPGMAGLLKETADSQLFTVFGMPELEIDPQEDNTWVVHLKGVEVYDPVANMISSTGANKVAAWFLDSDFDGRCFCITQAFFPNQDAWEKIAKALGSDADKDAFGSFNETTSLSFPAGKYNRVAVKVIDPRGNEVMVVRALEV